MRYLLWALLLFSTLHAQEPDAPVLTIKGLVLIDQEDHLLDADCLELIEGLNVQDVSIPGNPHELSERLAPLYLNLPLSEIKLNEIKQTIYSYYEEQGHPFVLVVIPPQEITSGVIQVAVIKAKLGLLKIEGNRWFCDRLIQRYIRVKEDQEIDLSDLERDLQFINRNPFRKVQMIFSPGEKAGDTDLILSMKDQFPLRVYAGADNTGIRTTGRERFFGGFNWGKAFGLDHLLSFQFTSSYEPSQFKAYTGQYIALLPWKHIFNVYGGYSPVKIPNLFGFHTKGRSTQASARYTIPVQFTLTTLDEFTVGFDFKSTNNTLEFSDLFINASQTVNLSQFLLGYKKMIEGRSYRLYFDGQVYWSPGKLFSHQSNADFNALRPGAKNRWVYGRALAHYTQELPKKFSLQLCLQGQLSSQNLLPSEEFGIGGYDTVRGYDERQLNSETAGLASLQLDTPSFPLFFRRGAHRDAFYFLGFIDYGFGKNHNALPGEPLCDYLLGAGPGFRYFLDPWITVRFDLGFKLHEQSLFTGGSPMVHFSAILNY